MATNSSHGVPTPASSQIDTTNPAVQVDALQELISDMLTTFVHAGQITPADAAPWWDAACAVVLNKPELLNPAVSVAMEAEAITRSACRE